MIITKCLCWTSRIQKTYFKIDHYTINTGGLWDQCTLIRRKQLKCTRMSEQRMLLVYIGAPSEWRERSVKRSTCQFTTAAIHYNNTADMAWKIKQSINRNTDVQFLCGFGTIKILPCSMSISFEQRLKLCYPSSVLGEIFIQAKYSCTSCTI